MTADFEIRGPLPSDKNYVCATWTKTLANGDPYLGLAEAGVLVDRILDDAKTRVIVADAGGGRLIGWAAYSKIAGLACLLYVYVQAQWRRKGVAKELLARAFGQPDRIVCFLKGPTCRSIMHGRDRPVTFAEIEDYLG